MTEIRGRAPVVARIGPAPQEKTSFALLPWYPSSFLSSTRGWSVTARGIYRELLDCQWDMGGLPSEGAELRQLIGATSTEWKAWPLVEQKFPLCADGLRRNTKLEEHRQRSVERSRKAADSAREKWRKAREGLPARGGEHDANA